MADVVIKRDVAPTTARLLRRSTACLVRRGERKKSSLPACAANGSALLSCKDAVLLRTPLRIEGNARTRLGTRSYIGPLTSSEQPLRPMTSQPLQRTTPVPQLISSSPASVPASPNLHTVTFDRPTTSWNWGVSGIYPMGAKEKLEAMRARQEEREITRAQIYAINALCRKHEQNQFAQYCASQGRGNASSSTQGAATSTVAASTPTRKAGNAVKTSPLSTALEPSEIFYAGTKQLVGRRIAG